MFQTRHDDTTVTHLPIRHTTGRPTTPLTPHRPHHTGRPATPGTWPTHSTPLPRQAPDNHPGQRATTNGPDRGDYLERLLQVLEHVAHSAHPVSLSQIRAELDLPMTTIHRLLITLWTAGILNRDPKRRYLVGHRLRTLLGDQTHPDGDAS
ncbi:helix-turn-helix domain-containing protein [Actinosynnema sp. CA-248983]